MLDNTFERSKGNCRNKTELHQTIKVTIYILINEIALALRFVEKKNKKGSQNIFSIIFQHISFLVKITSHLIFYPFLSVQFKVQWQLGCKNNAKIYKKKSHLHKLSEQKCPKEKRLLLIQDWIESWLVYIKHIIKL